ncbi:malonyl-[acyl-carrier protein] O-methyltransferase [Methylogaea oryzae]|uniref:Malonyl-[acyl-carrier protein] O-methyltransferase n=1 Tax=Methylogaea oryzae TaxID=1295382 RepID=A0A8D5ALR6_9GAMM|nr:malonyl-[acyl-carrier protein] O-methyltransferase [Methylogaea oryzae]
MPDKRQVRLSFGRAAARYDQYADLQRRAGLALLQRLDIAPDDIRLVLDVGSGTGYFLPRLANRFPRARLVAVDLAEEMLEVGRGRLAGAQAVCGDAEALPFAAGCADVAYSNLALQWCGSLQRPLTEVARVLRPGGVVAVGLFGADTLVELRQAWAAVDGYRRVNEFVTADDLRQVLERAGFASIDIQTRREVVEYPSVRELMRELKGLGAHNVSGGRPRHMTGKTALARMEAAYRERMGGGSIQATYEILGALACRT